MAKKYFSKGPHFILQTSLHSIFDAYLFRCQFSSENSIRGKIFWSKFQAGYKISAASGYRTGNYIVWPTSEIQLSISTVIQVPLIGMAVPDLYEQ